VPLSGARAVLSGAPDAAAASRRARSYRSVALYGYLAERTALLPSRLGRFLFNIITML